MVNQNTTTSGSMHLHDVYSFMGHTMSACTSALHGCGFRTRLVPTTGLVQGRIVSISRGSPPPKKR